jgi:hypothetical protein
MKSNIIKFTTEKKERVIFMCTILNKIKNKEPYELLKEYKISIEPPIDISRLLKEIGISTIAYDFTDIENVKNVEHGSILGAAFSKDDDLAIFYKRSDSLHRQKFTIAHELGHCCLHCPNEEASHIEYRLDKTLEFTDNQAKEKEANIFAGKLLIPEEALVKFYEKMIVPSLTDLANIFKVSTSVMSARLDYLKMPYFKDSFN